VPDRVVTAVNHDVDTVGAPGCGSRVTGEDPAL
jgi:hypothetical protein